MRSDHIVTGPTGARERRPQLIRHRVLTAAPAVVADHELQVQFDKAQLRSRARGADRLAEALTVDVLAADVLTADEVEPAGADTELEIGHMNGFDPRSVDALAVVRDSLELAAGPGSEAWLQASDSALGLDRSTGASGESGPTDPLRPGYVFGRLNEGWQVVVRNPRGLGPQLQALLDDLCLVTGAEATLHFGIRGALGPMPTQLAHRQLVIQVAGRRGVVIHNTDGQKQARLHPGQVLLVAPDRQLSHLPLDEDTLFLTMPLITDWLEEQDRAASSLMAARSGASYHTAQAVMNGDPAVGWPFRMIAPGGVHLVEAGDTSVDLAVGGLQVTVSEVGAQLLLELASGEFRTGADLAAVTDCDVAAAVVFCEELWGLGLLAPEVPTAAPLDGGERLTQVASTPDGHGAPVEPLLARIDEDAWRPSAPGEVHHGSSVDVAVQALSFDEHDATLAPPLAMALQMNAQFFGLDVAHAVAADPPLLVRVRPGSNAPGPSEALGSDLVAFPNRKLTFVMALSDADGGWIHLPAGSPAGQAAAGSVSAWPALRPWEVTPIEAGERLFLLCRLHGPGFR